MQLGLKTNTQTETSYDRNHFPLCSLCMFFMLSSAVRVCFQTPLADVKKPVVWEGDSAVV